MKIDWRSSALLFAVFLVARGDDKITNPHLGADDPKALRDLIQKATANGEPKRTKTPDISQLRESLVNSKADTSLSVNLTEMLKVSAAIDDVQTSAILLKPAEAIADPSINVIDSHVSQVINMTGSQSQRFTPDQDEIELIAKERQQKDATVFNVYRESLQIDGIREMTSFKFGEGVEQWKSFTISIDKVALVGKTSNSVFVMIGHNDSYRTNFSIPFDVQPGRRLLIETLKIWDSHKNHVRDLILVGANQQLIWYELSELGVVELQRWNILKEIDSVAYFNHDGSDILLVSLVDENGKVQAELIEFNVPNGEFWVLQVFPLQDRSPSMAPLDLGRDLIVAFVQTNKVLVYRHHLTNHLRGRFTLFKTIEAANVSSISGFRIGGNSYLAIGGDQSKILRYINGDFTEQTILSQTFGTVEQFLPVPIRTYRDDLVLLVQHRLNLATHSIVVVDALIWNGVAFGTVLSVPCNISSDPHANSFTCMLDPYRNEGLIGATFIHQAKQHRLLILVPRYQVHSGLFRVHYSIVDVEDPIMKDIEQTKNSIKFLNRMLDYEDSVRNEIKEALKSGVNAKDDFEFEDLELREIDTEFLEIDRTVSIEKDAVQFLGVKWTQNDFLMNLDDLENVIASSESRLKFIDDKLNQLNRIYRQAPPAQQQSFTDSPIHNIGTFPFNGQLKSINIHYSQERPRQQRQINPIKESRVSALTVRNLEVETINGILVSDLLFLENGQLIIPEQNVIFEQSVEVDNVNMAEGGKVNGVEFSHEVLAVESPNPAKHLILENISIRDVNVQRLNSVPVDFKTLNDIQVSDEELNLSAEKVLFRDDLNVSETINGVKWNEFVSMLIPKHLPSAIDEIFVNGNVYIVGEFSQLNAKSLNKIPFPEGYVLKDGPQEGNTITGKKTFLSSLRTNAIDIDGMINQIEPADMITLDQIQEISGHTTFREMEVIKKLEVNGTISGRKLEEFLPNPTIKEVREVKAACNFKELIVQGSIIIEDTLDGEILEAFLGDVVYETADGSEIVITAPKTFMNLEVQGDLTVGTNFINNQNLDNFMMTDRDQAVTFNALQGEIYFSNLHISGFYDEINATELERSSVRTFGDQFIQTPIVIEQGHRVEAKAVEITSSLNEVPVGDYAFIDQPITLNSASFESLKVDDMKLSGDIIGPGTLVNLNLADIATNYLSKSRQQNISGPVEIKSLTTNETFTAGTINGMSFDVFRNYMRGIKNFKSSIFSGDKKIGNLIVEGDVNLKTINDQDFNQIVENVIWLNRPNKLEHHFTFLDDIEVDGLLTLKGSLHNKPFKVWAENWISMYENPIVVNSNTIFLNTVMIEESLEAATINGIRFENIVLKSDVMKLDRLNVQGAVKVEEIHVEGTFNQAPVKLLHDLYYYDAPTYTHVINSDVHFNHPVNVNHFHTPSLNSMNVTHWIANLIRKDDSNVYITSEKVFVKNFNANQLTAEFFNDIHLDFLNRIVLNNGDGIVEINGDLVFNNDTYSQFIGVKGDITTTAISGYKIKDWLYFALPTDRKLHFGGTLRIAASALKPEIFTFDYINGIPFANLFTVNTNQTFDRLRVQDLIVQKPLTVHELVNNIKIENERANTVMKNEPYQIVTGKTSFAAVRVQGPMTVLGKVNSKDLNKAIILNSSPTIRSAVNFKSLQGHSLHTNNIINGINFSKWYENVLWARGKDQQVVSGKWAIKTVHLSDDVTGNGLINEVAINDIERNLKSSVNAIETAISDSSGKYHELCSTLSLRANESLYSIHILKHFDLDFIIKEATDIFSYFGFSTPSNEYYLAVNTNCTTQMYKWLNAEQKFIKLELIVTGVVYDWAIVKSVKGDVFIITSSRMEANYPCQFGGLNTWKINGDRMFHVNSIPIESEVLELRTDNLQPSRFYALDNLDHVSHFEIFGEKKGFWKLPTEHYNYSFMPPEVSNSLMLFNGRNLFKLPDSEIRYRQKRNWISSPILSHSKVTASNGDSSTLYNFRMPDPSIQAKHQLPFAQDRHQNESDFFYKVRKVGATVKQRLRESMNLVPKLTIKNSSVLPADESLRENLSTRKSATIRPLRPTTLKSKTTIEDHRESATEASDPKKSSKKTSFKFKQFDKSNITKAPSEVAAANDQNVGGFLDKLRNIGEGIKIALNSRNSTIPSEAKHASESREEVTKSSIDSVEMTSTSTPAVTSTPLARPLVHLPEHSDSKLQHGEKESETGGHQEEENSITPRIVMQSEDLENAKRPTFSSATEPVDIPDIFPHVDDRTFPKYFPYHESESVAPHRNADVTPTDVISSEPSDDTDKNLEQEVPHTVIQSSGLIKAENAFIPERGHGEFIMMHVGPNNHKRSLYAVTRNRESVIKGNNNDIEIYNDIFEGYIYQYIHCSDPSNLVALHFRDETLLAFLESRMEIHIYIYRGVQGFVSFKRIKLPGYATQMTALTLPPKIDYKCDLHYLAVKLETEILFYGVKIAGNCGLKSVYCDNI